MIFEPKQFNRSVQFIFSSGYKNNHKSLLTLLKRTRYPILKKSNFYLAIVQLGIIDAVVEIQESISELNKEKAKSIENKTDTAHIDRALRNNKEILRIIYTISDGIVARAFKFDRPILRVMSENKQFGHLQKDTIDHVGVLKNVLKSLSRNGLCIVNDITRYLRIGDVSVIRKGGNITLYEVKTKAETGKTRLIDVGQILTNIIENKNFPNKQNQRHIIAQMAIITRRISIPEKVDSPKQPYKEKFGVDIIDLPIRIRHYMVEVGRALKASKKQIITRLNLEEGYSISILRCDQLTPENARSVYDDFNREPKWFDRESEYMFRVTNIQSFITEENEFPRNILPYSVFPFDADDCLKLMSGEIYIAVFFDLRKLEKKLKISGWEVKDGEVIKELRSKEPYQNMERNGLDMFGRTEPSVFHLSKETKHGRYRCSIPATQLLSAMFSFYTSDFLVDIVNEQLSISEPRKGGYVTYNFIDEQNIYK